MHCADKMKESEISNASKEEMITLYKFSDEKSEGKRLRDVS
jgi:hypothetical protein